MSTDKDKALSKIHKLLRLAKDGRGNATEAETAMRQAQALMRRFNIDEAEATHADLKNSPDAIIRAWCKAGYHAKAIMRTVPTWTGLIAVGVGKLYECRVAVAKGPDNAAVGVVFGGYHVDVQVATWTFEYLLDCVKRAGDLFEDAVLNGKASVLQEMGLQPQHALYLLTLTSKRRKGEFRQGMATELQHRLYAMAEEREVAQQVSPAAGALVIAKQAALDAHFGETNTRKHKAKASTAAAAAGHNTGSKTNLSPGPLASSARATAPALLT